MLQQNMIQRTDVPEESRTACDERLQLTTIGRHASTIKAQCKSFVGAVERLRRLTKIAKVCGLVFKEMVWRNRPFKTQHCFGKSFPALSSKLFKSNSYKQTIS